MTLPKTKQTWTCKCGREYATVTVGAMTVIIDGRTVDRVVKALGEVIEGDGQGQAGTEPQ